jgi:hypothetical protein
MPCRIYCRFGKDLQLPEADTHPSIQMRSTIGSLRRCIAQRARLAFAEHGTLRSDGGRRRAAQTFLLLARRPRAV